MNSYYNLLRRPFFYRLFIWVLNKAAFLLPARRLFETRLLLAFNHPKPIHRFHVILVPRKAVRSLAELDTADPFLPELVSVVQDMVKAHHLTGYRLVVNGGEYQEFPHLHFHLLSDSQPGRN